MIDVENDILNLVFDLVTTSYSASTLREIFHIEKESEESIFLTGLPVSLVRQATTMSLTQATSIPKNPVASRCVEIVEMFG